MTVSPAEQSQLRDEALDALRARLHAFIARRVESVEVADDLTQDVLLRLLISDAGQHEKPTTWLYRVARNVIIDHYRARASRSRRASEAAVPNDPGEDPFAEDPGAAERELAPCLRSLVDQLEEPYRSAVQAADLDGHTQTEAAHAASLSVSGMKSRVQRGRRQLRDLLTECCRVHTSPGGSVIDFDTASCEDASCSGRGA